MISTKKALDSIKSSCFQDTLLSLYSDSSVLHTESDRYEHAINSFKSLFSNEEISIYSAPGRTEICGNHTDHQLGQVLCASINLDMIGIVGLSNNNLISINPENMELFQIDTSKLNQYKKEGSTSSLVAGICTGFLNRGYKIGGFNMFISSEIMIGSGLSSSAAFELLVGFVLSDLFNNGSIPIIELSKIGQYAENTFFGKPCGLMDQLACGYGGLIHIDFANNNPQIERIPFPINVAGYKLSITDTRSSHADLTNDFASITEEMLSISRYFGKNYLSEVSEIDFFNNISSLRNNCSDRAILRAIHYFNENKRVLDAVKALKENNLSAFVEVIRKSGNSSFKYLQNVYSCSSATSQGISLALCLSERILDKDEVSRVHGGGFAGTIQAYVKSEHVETYRELMDSTFGANSCHILSIRDDGVRKVI